MQNRPFTHNAPSLPERTKKALHAFKYACEAFHDQSFRDQGNYYPIPTVMFMDGRQFNTKPMLAMSETAGNDRCVVYSTKSKKFFMMEANGNVGLPFTPSPALKRAVAYFEEHRETTKDEKALIALFLKEVEAYNAFKVQMEAQAEVLDSTGE
jgi:hypothetical protein